MTFDASFMRRHAEFRDCADANQIGPCSSATRIAAFPSNRFADIERRAALASLYKKSRLWLRRARALCKFNCGKERLFDARGPLHPRIVTSFSDVVWQATTSSAHST